MEILGRKKIDSLIEKKSDYCISIYLPVHPLGDKQDSIRYKNLLGRAEKMLVEKGMRGPEATKLLQPEYDLARVIEYWENMGTEGLAVFCDGKTWERYPLPLKFSESVTVGKRFRIKPLIPLLTGDGRFFILALSKGDTKLFLGSRFSITAVSLPESAPKSLDEALQYDEPQTQLQYHTSTASTGARRQAMFHGHGVGIDDERENITRFFQQLATKLHPVFSTEKIAVILAGVESLPPLYREQDSTGMLVPGIIAGNPESLTPKALHEKAWQLMAPLFAAEEKKARAKFLELHGTGQTSTDIAEIAGAAKAGRIETLFAEENAELWGVFDAEKFTAKLTGQDAPDAADFLDLAAAWTLKGGGTVYIKKQGDMPAAEPAAAVLRY